MSNMYLISSRWERRSKNFKGKNVRGFFYIHVLLLRYFIFYRLLPGFLGKKTLLIMKHWEGISKFPHAYLQSPYISEVHLSVNQ